MQYTELRSVLEMIPAQTGRHWAVTGIAFSCDGRVLAKGGASMHIRLHNFESVLSAGTKCAPLPPRISDVSR